LRVSGGDDSLDAVEAAVSPLPNKVDALQALLAMATQRADEAEAALANARARETAAQAMIAHLKLQNAKLRREQYGPSAERTERLHGDDTTVSIMAKGKTITGRLWDYVRDDRPFGGNDPPSVAFYYSRDRRGDHPRRHLAAWSGILQADAYAGYNELYAPNRRSRPILEAGCFAHARRKFFELADVEGAVRKKSRGEKAGVVYPIALEAVQKLDALFAIERDINGKSPGRAYRRPLGTQRAADGRAPRMVERTARPDLA
jgi:hypothetical protein